MRVSAHDLEIEKGRHHNIQRKLRLCKKLFNTYFRKRVPFYVSIYKTQMSKN